MGHLVHRPQQNVDVVPDVEVEPKPVFAEQLIPPGQQQKRRGDDPACRSEHAADRRPADPAGRDPDGGYRQKQAGVRDLALYPQPGKPGDHRGRDRRVATPKHRGIGGKRSQLRDGFRPGFLPGRSEAEIDRGRKRWDADKRHEIPEFLERLRL